MPLLADASKQAQNGPQTPQKGRTLPTGSLGASVRLREASSGTEREVWSTSRPMTGMLAAYQAEADRAGVTLETALRTLPRAGMSIETVYSADMKAAKVRVWLEETLPSYDRQSARAEYESIADRIEVIMSEAMAEVRDALGI